ncbi:MAG: iron ABC transporter permease [Pelosinus sp.]|nr:iron ABC transporter permease [Pelosinus sp.]
MKKVWLILLMVCLGVLVLAFSAGRYAIGLKDIGVFFLHACGIAADLPQVPKEMQMIFWNIRVPRIVLSFAVGSGISIAGAVFQALFRNPLAAPETLGATFGAGFGAAVAIMFFTHMIMGIQTFAFLFSILAVTATYLLASRCREQSASVLVIAGIVISALFEAGLSVLEYWADPYDQLAQILFWLWGSFQTASWSKVETTVPIVLIGCVMLYIFAWQLDIMTLEDEAALSLGVNIVRWRVFYIVVSNVMIAASVASVGSIKWLGLIIPHIARHFVGTEHRKLLPVTAVLGGTFLVAVDTLARSISSAEIPISVLTAIIGAPYLGYLILWKKEGGGELGS